MKKILILILFICLKNVCVAQTKWASNPDSSRVEFSIKEAAFFKVRGRFTNFTASMISYTHDLKSAVFHVKIRTNSINTNIKKRDHHLLSADFFDAERYPDINFESSSIKQLNSTEYVITGNLTMHGVTKSIPLHLTLTDTSKNQEIKSYNMSVNGIINRKDFGIDKYRLFIGDKVKIQATGVCAPSN